MRRSAATDATANPRCIVVPLARLDPAHLFIVRVQDRSELRFRDEVVRQEAFGEVKREFEADREVVHDRGVVPPAGELAQIVRVRVAARGQGM